MTDTQQRVAAKAFAKNWKDRGYEKGDSQIFWVELLTTVFGVTEISQFISFEDQVHLDHTSFIDGYIEKTHVMIEQKSINKSLTAAIRQSDGSMLTPFEQAKRYSSELPYSKRPRWIVTSNFQSFYIYDMEKPGGDPEIIQLENLEKEYYRLQFLVDEGNTNLQREMEVSIAAGEIVGLLYDALAKQYVDPTTERAMKSLNILCVRMVFCLYAEDAGIFGQHGMFHDYLEEFDARKMRKAMIELFQILDTKPEDRDPYLKDDNPQLAAFPYVNGELFANEDIEIPPFTDEIRNLLLEKASADFDWSEISPTIFGAVFESTLNPETRRSGGMHYTSIENIHKVIDPLFLDDLKNELKEIQQITVQRTKDKKLRDFQTRLASLRWLDPASGSGNFLTETYISIRRLENEVIKELQRGQITFGFDESSPIHVSIDQFYGIEINDFAVTVAKTALWIAESQMMKETEDIVHMNLDFLPLTTNAFIVEGNSLQIDWESVVPKYQVSYIMGNPPFVGYSLQSKEQKKDIISVYVDEKGKTYKMAGKIDYVSGWYFKTAQFMQGTMIRAAFVSTNSITQGEQVAGVWKEMQFSYALPVQSTELHGKIFGTDNEDILNNLLGAIYIDQEKGWTLLNRGKVIAGVHFNIYELIRGLSGRSCSDIIMRKKKVEENLKKYKQILNIAEYRESITPISESLTRDSYNRERLLKLDQLKVERDAIKKEIKRLDDNIKNNKKAIEFIDDMKLVIRLNNGEEICVTRDMVVGASDSIDLLQAKKKMIISRLERILKEIEDLELEIKEEEQQLSLFPMESLADVFDRKMAGIDISPVDVKNVIDDLDKEKKALENQISQFTNDSNDVTQSMIKTVQKYMEELGDSEAEKMTWKYLFTKNLKELSGAVLHKTVFSFRLAYIIEIEKALGIKLPILLDSPKGKEVDDTNIAKMMQILQRDFPDNQIIIASIYHYVPNEHVITLERQLLDQTITIN